MGVRAAGARVSRGARAGEAGERLPLYLTDKRWNGSE
jgi:hypothetical protein